MFCFKEEQNKSILNSKKRTVLVITMLKFFDTCQETKNMKHKKVNLVFSHIHLVKEEYQFRNSEETHELNARLKYNS